MVIIGEMEWYDWWRLQVRDIFCFSRPDPECKVCFYPGHRCKTPCPGKAYYAPGQPGNPEGTEVGVRLPKGYKLPPKFANWTTPKRKINHPYISPQPAMGYTSTARGGGKDTLPSSAGTRLPAGTHDHDATSSPQSAQVPSNHPPPHRGHGSRSGRNNQPYRATTGRRIGRSSSNSSHSQSDRSVREEYPDRSDRSRSSSFSSRGIALSYHTYNGSGSRREDRARLSYISEDDGSLESSRF